MNEHEWIHVRGGGNGDSTRWRAGLLPENDIRAAAWRWMDDVLKARGIVESVNLSGMHARQCEKDTKCRWIT